MIFSAAASQRGQIINQIAAEKRLHKILDKPDQIAATLNRLGFRTGFDNTWTKTRIQSLRNKLDLPPCNPDQPRPAMLTLEQAAERLSTNRTTLKRLIEQKILPATQIVSGAPWEIPEESIQSPAVIEAIKKVAAPPRIPRTENTEGQEYLFVFVYRVFRRWREFTHLCFPKLTQAF